MIPRNREPVLNLLEEKLLAALAGESPSVKLDCQRALTQRLGKAIAAGSTKITLTVVTPRGDLVLPVSAALARGWVRWNALPADDARLPLFPAADIDAYSFVLDGPERELRPILAKASPAARQRFAELSRPLPDAAVPMILPCHVNSHRIASS